MVSVRSRRLLIEVFYMSLHGGDSQPDQQGRSVRSVIAQLSKGRSNALDIHPASVSLECAERQLITLLLGQKVTHTGRVKKFQPGLHRNLSVSSPKMTALGVACDGYMLRAQKGRSIFTQGQSKASAQRGVHQSTCCRSRGKRTFQLSFERAYGRPQCR